MFITGHVLQGLCTSLMLIAAVPPLAFGFGAKRLRETAVIMNLCIFGAVALGPTIGGIQAQAGGWRPLFFAVAGISLAALVLTILTFEDAPPADPRAPFDPLAIALAASGSVLAFFGASELLTHKFLDPIAFVPLVTGLTLIVVLIVYQFRAKRPLLTIRTHAHEHDAGGRNRRRPVRGRCVGVRIRVERGAARGTLRAAARGAAISA